MPYVRRDAEGRIASLHREAEAGATEFLPDEHALVQGFVGNPPTADRETFARLDADFVRVVEDVIDALIARHVINITDLPPEAQAKLCSRKTFRGRAQQQALDLFGSALAGFSLDPDRPPAV